MLNKKGFISNVIYTLDVRRLEVHIMGANGKEVLGDEEQRRIRQLSFVDPLVGAHIFERRRSGAHRGMSWKKECRQFKGSMRQTNRRRSHSRESTILECL